MTKEEATNNLEEWLERAVRNSIYNKYDKMCSEAYDVLGDVEYGLIYKKWASGYVSCPDGYYRKK